MRRLPRRVAQLRNPIALIVIAVAGGSRGVDYLMRDQLTEGTQKATNIIDGLLPLDVYAMIWLAASVTFLAGVVAHGRLFVWAGSISAALWGLWAFAFVSSQLFNGSSSGIMTGCAFAALALATLSLVQEEVEHGTIQLRRRHG